MNAFEPKRALRSLLRRLGYDLVRASDAPYSTMLGLAAHPFRTVVDVGANVGQFAQRARATFPEARVLCFEPLPTALETLRGWADGQGGLVEVLPVALGAEAGTAEFHLHTEHSPSSSFLSTTETQERLYPQTQAQAPVTVQVTTLDEALRGKTLEDDILVKMDVQGFEDRVVKGGTETLKRAAACVLEINLDSLYEGQASFHELANALHELGLTYAGNVSQVYGEDGHVVYIDAVFRR